MRCVACRRLVIANVVRRVWWLGLASSFVRLSACCLPIPPRFAPPLFGRTRTDARFSSGGVSRGNRNPTGVDSAKSRIARRTRHKKTICDQNLSSASLQPSSHESSPSYSRSYFESIQTIIKDTPTLYLIFLVFFHLDICPCTLISRPTSTKEIFAQDVTPFCTLETSRSPVVRHG